MADMVPCAVSGDIVGNFDSHQEIPTIQVQARRLRLIAHAELP
jgi:hypothetical protein